MRDTRRIQTAVLGSAESDQPLILPLEAIEVDAFRQRHTADTFWCGRLLGGCGGQLTTKLYTDRVCHFAHHPDASGQPRICGRSARGVASADHLYVKSAASAWLKERGRQASFHYPQTGDIPVGSIVDIIFDDGGRLRVHLDQAVAPAWDDEGVEPVLGTSVPVDDETLVERWFVHRVRFDSVGTARRVRLGTEAFAREIEWFTFDECEMTPHGLRTPAVERIIRDRSTPPPRAIPTRPITPTGPQAPSAARRPDLTDQLAAAIRSASVLAVRSLCRDIEDSLPHHDGAAGQELARALELARDWLDEQDEARRALFTQLQTAVDERVAVRVRALLTRADATAGSDRSKSEDATANAAAMFLEDLKRSARWEHRDTAPRPRSLKLRTRSRVAPRELSAARQPPAQRLPAPERNAHHRMRELLQDLRRLAKHLPDDEVRRMVKALKAAAASARPLVTAEQRRDVERWIQRAAAMKPGRAGAADVDGERRRQDRAPRRRAERPARPPSSGGTTGRRGRRPEPKSTGPPRLTADTVPSVAAAVRGALKKAARERATTSWSRLGHQLGSALPPLHPDDKAEVLHRVDKNTPRDEPLLLSLLAVDDTAQPDLYQRLAARLGRELPAEADQARGHWQHEVLKLHQVWRYQ